MKDNKEDDTVRYKNTLESYENSLNNISEEKILKAITKEENKNIIDKLYDCGDELSNEDINSQLNNYYLNEINKNGEKDENNSKRERYNINMFNFIENDDCTDNKISLNNGTEDKEQQLNTSKEIINTNNKYDTNNSNESNNNKNNDVNYNQMINNDLLKNKMLDDIIKTNEKNEIDNDMNLLKDKNIEFINNVNNMKKNNHIDLNKYKLDTENKNSKNNYSIDEKEKTDKKLVQNENYNYGEFKKEIFNESIYENSNEKMNKNITENNNNYENIKFNLNNNYNNVDNKNNYNNKEDNLDNTFEERQKEEFNDDEENEKENNNYNEINKVKKTQKENHNKSMEY